jgi:hypothetical protein
MLSKEEMEAFADFASLRAFWLQENANLLAWVRSLAPEDANRDVRGPHNRRASLWQVVFQIVNHCVEHGNEIGWGLTAQGQSPGDLGFMRWRDQQDTSRN